MNRTTGGIFLLPLLGTAVYAMLAFGAEWRGSWDATTDAATGSTVLTGPLTAAFAAHVALAQSRMADLSRSTARGSLVPYRSAFQAWAWSSVVYVLTAAGGFVVTAAIPHGGPFAWWAPLIGFFVLGACAFAGALAVQLWPHRMAVILVAPLVFLFGAFGPYPYADLLRQGPGSGSLAGLEFVPSTWLLQVVGLIGLGGGLAAAMSVWMRGRVRLVAVLSGLGAIALLIGAGTALRADGHHSRFRASDERPTACAGAPPTACLAPSNRRLLAGTSRSMHLAAPYLRALGVDLPERYEELLPGGNPSVDAGMISSPSDEPRRSGLQGGARILVEAAGCPAWVDPSGPPPDGAFDGQQLIVDWILTVAGQHVPTWSSEEKAWLADADAPTARRWVRETFDQLRHCELDQIELPWHPKGP